MDYERLLIAKTAQTGRIQNLLATGIRDDHFLDEELQAIFRFMADHARSYRQAPSFQTVQEQFPLHNFEVTDESVDYLRDQFFKGVMRRHAIDAIRDLAEVVDDPEQVGNIDSLFLEKSRELATIAPQAKLHKFSDMLQRIEEYEAGSEKEKSIYMGIPDLDRITQGIQSHEYVTISGWSGTGKSTLAQWILFNSWMQGKTPMYISLEMEANALFRKWDTMLTHFQYHDLKAHQLREEQIQIWKEKAEEVASKPNDIIVMDDVRGCTVDRVYAELVRWRPDILCIDYITLMDVSRSRGNAMWEKVMYITQSLKQVSRTLKIPIIGVAQTNRASAQAGAELDNIAYSVSIVQDSDMVLGLRRDEEMKENKMMEVKMLKNRDGMTDNTNLFWDMDTMTFGPWSETRAFMGHRERQNI